jgi:hypothetical protein
MRRVAAALMVVSLALGGLSAAPADAQVGTQFCPEISHSVLRLYRAYFTRNPDQSGYDYWLQKYLAGTPLTSISEAFTGSPEFQSTYYGLDNHGFVQRVYQNVLGRDPDQAGWNYWTQTLDQGRLRRGGVMVLFSESPEFVSRTKTASPIVVPPGTFTYCGAGDDVIRINTPGGGKGAILTAVMYGSGNNVIVSHGAGNSYNDLLVNAIGKYVGENLMDLSPYDAKSESLEINANGNWIIQIRPLSAAQSFYGGVGGSGDRVLRYTGGRAVGHFTHNGQRNFIIEAVTSADWDLVVNEIGPYDGRTPVDVAPAYMAVSADGAWTMTIPG